MSVYGGCYYRFNEPGCFVWARVLPNGRVYVQADMKFIHKAVGVVAEDVLARTRTLEIQRFTAIYADPEMFPSAKSERRVMEAEAPSRIFARSGLPMIPSGSNLIHGWSRVHDYLRLAPDGRPWLVIDPSCSALVRTLPAIVKKTNDPDDCEGELYAAHALRILLSARPAPSSLSAPKKAYAWGTVGWLRNRDQPKRGLLTR